MPERDNDARKSPRDDNRRISSISNILFRRRKLIEESQENISIVHERPELKAPTPNSDSFASARTQTSEDASQEGGNVEGPSRRDEGSCGTRSMGDGANGVEVRSPNQRRASIDWDERIEAMRKRQRDNSAPNPFAFF